MCGAKPKERCKLSTGKPCAKTHLDRSVAAAKAGPPEHFAHAALRILKATTSRGFHMLFNRT
jgi:hypothetical protein